MSLDSPADQDIIIVGATGDLSRRKLIPALYNLFLSGLFPQRGEVIGFARSKWTEEEFRDVAAQALQKFSRTGFNERAWSRFARRLRYVSSEDGGFKKLEAVCKQPERLVYLSVPPSTFPATARAFGENGLVEGTRVIVEKPFGRDLGSSRELDQVLHSVFNELQIFRIDHYLGKETVQNILVFRLGNSVFERIWNRDAIDHVQITVAEAIGIEGRGAFYEETGALRDIIQNHVFQVLSLLTMEPPASFEGEAIRDEKAKVFLSLQTLDPARVVRGQYIRGRVGGEDAPGYREEPGVASDSQTETYVALQVAIDNWRWAGVPFFLRTGKRLPRRTTEVDIVFRDVPVSFFRRTGVEDLQANRLTIQIQPDEAIRFSFEAKAPGPEIQLQPVEMRFDYGEQWQARSAEAYERLLHDAMDGDHTLFARGDGVDRCWQVVQPVLEAMPPVTFYPAGSWGPTEADQLIAPRSWLVQ
jgi:glucose-6-phosphate 1-dehydrogenase